MLKYQYKSIESKYLRGNPCNPKKCIGKNIKFTPIKNNTKKIIIKFSLILILNKSSHHKFIPVKIPKTAPILKT
jgi:hypothetical protein